MKLTRKAFKEWGKQGGKKRAANLTPERRRAIAKKAIAARWKKQKGAR
jgi:hypothetical protein